MKIEFQLREQHHGGWVIDAELVNPSTEGAHMFRPLHPVFTCASEAFEAFVVAIEKIVCGGFCEHGPDTVDALADAILQRMPFCDSDQKQAIIDTLRENLRDA